MANWFFIYLIGIVVGIALDNIFWYAYVKIKELDNE
jgi:hypothetical protein